MATKLMKAPVDFTSFSNIIDGKPRNAETYYQGINPATKEKLWRVPVATRQDLDDAVIAARRAFPAWSQVPFEERQTLLKAFADAYIAYKDEFTELLLKESGKPRTHARREVELTYSGWFIAHTQVKLPVDKFEDEEKTVETTYHPLGIVGAICPWNFPLTLSVGKIAPALVTGNCIIVKPSPFTPYTALKLVEIAQSFFPPGVIQVLGGDEQLGPWMTSHHDIQKISFTGSTNTGKRIMEACARTLKRVTLELGGNDPCIVLPDVDIAKVAPEVAMGAFFNSGQVCVATKRIYIHASIYKQFLAALVAATRKLTTGDTTKADTILGPVQNEMQYERVSSFFREGEERGYQYAIGGSLGPPSTGYFIQPTLVDNPPADSKVVLEEPFGPILPTLPFSSPDATDAIQAANALSHGLAASVWTGDIALAHKIANQLECGSVFINSWAKPDPHVEFGGWKESGIGSEWGPRGILAYCVARAVHVYKPS